MAVDLERVDLPAASVEREHQPGAQRLAHRLLAHEPFELRDDPRVLAGRQRSVDASLDRVGARLLEPGRLSRKRGDELEPGQRRAAPQFERLLEVARRHEPRELERVDVLVSRDEPIAVRRALQPLAPQRLAQSGDVGLHRLARSDRWIVAPQLVDQPADRHHPVRPDRQQAEQRLRLATAERDRPPIVAVHLQRSKQSDLHRAPSRLRLNVDPLATGCLPGRRSVDRVNALHERSKHAPPHHHPSAWHSG